MRLWQQAVLVPCLMLMTALAACDSGSRVTGSADERAFTLELSQSQLTLGVGSSVAIQALVRDDEGRSLSGRAVFWSSSDTAVAAVSPGGVVTARSVGTAQIAATVGGRSAVANLTVAPRAVASIELTPSNPAIPVGGRVQLTARLLDAEGEELEGRVVTWTSSAPSRAVVDTTGLVTGTGAGSATITATSEGRTASVGVTVSQVPVASIAISPASDEIVVGQTTQLTATVRDEAGALLDQRPIAWSSSNTAVANVSSSGLVLAGAQGTATITATSEGRSAQAQITVKPRPVSSVIVSPGQAAIVVGETVRLTVQVTDENGALLSGRPVQFRSDNTAIAQVAADGTVTGIAAGTTTITVTSEGRSAVAQITVSPVPVASVRITPASADLVVGSSTKLSAVALDAAGNVLTQRPISWTSGSPAVATVGSDGTVVAVGVGTAVIVATSEGRVGTATINVRAVPVASVVVSPSTAALTVGEATNLTFVARDAGGNILQGRNAHWTSSNDAVAAVSSTGRVIGIAPGTVQITASVEGVKGTSTVTVGILPVASVSVALSPSTVTEGQTSQATATLSAANGSVLTGRAIAWSSSNTAVATVNASGVVTALSPGTATITATSEGKSGSATLTVQPVPVARVEITPSEATITIVGASAGRQVQLTAKAYDASNRELTGRTFTWTSSNPSVAPVTNTGLVTSSREGTTTITASTGGRSGTATVTVVRNF